MHEVYKKCHCLQFPRHPEAGTAEISPIGTRSRLRRRMNHCVCCIISGLFEGSPTARATETAHLSRSPLLGGNTASSVQTRQKNLPCVRVCIQHREMGRISVCRVLFDTRRPWPAAAEIGPLVKKRDIQRTSMPSRKKPCTTAYVGTRGRS